MKQLNLTNQRSFWSLTPFVTELDFGFAAPINLQKNLEELKNLF